jgi:GPH family glycoside/pentoside/hexuronide:cation symporter
MLRNRPFLILLASYTVSAFGSNLPATLILFYVEYVLGAARAEPYLLAYFATGIACLPAWVALSRRRGKKTAWLASMALNTGAFAGVFFLGPGDLAAYAVLVVLSGVGFGATLAIPSSMQADVIDYDELLSGARREGRYVGVWSVARKLAAAAGVGASLAILGAAGYRPNEPQSTDVVFTLRVLYAAVPCLCNAAAIAIALAYPIDRAAHGRILAAIEQRRRGVAAGDPLAAAPLPGTAG